MKNLQRLLQTFAFSRQWVMKVIRKRRSSSPNKAERKTLMILLGLVFVPALILPSVLVYRLNRPGVSHTRLVAPVGFTNYCSGISPNTLWVPYDFETMTMRVNTSQCHFQKTALYFVGLNGLGNHFCLTGYNAISSPTQDSFQVYARPTCLPQNVTYLISFAQWAAYDLFWTGFSSWINERTNVDWLRVDRIGRKKSVCVLCFVRRFALDLNVIIHSANNGQDEWLRSSQSPHHHK